MFGIGVSLVAMIAVRLFTPLAWTWYVLVGTGICVVVGLLASRRRGWTRCRTHERAPARLVIEKAIAARVFPAAAVEVGSGDGAMWSDAIGFTTFDQRRPIALDTPFDLASLTKAIADDDGRHGTGARPALYGSPTRWRRSFAEWRGADRDGGDGSRSARARVGSAGAAARSSARRTTEFEHDICTMPLEYPPRTRSIYSDLGFILLGFLAADRGGAPLDRAVRRI